MFKQQNLLGTILVGVIGVALGLNTGVAVFAEPSGGLALSHPKKPEQEMAVPDQSSGLEQKLSAIIENTTTKDACLLAEKYYKRAYPNLESDLRAEYHRLVPRPPLFDGKDNGHQVMFRTPDVALTISYTNAKNYYLALACAGFDADLRSVDAATNLATAIATYYDDLYFAGQKNQVLKKECYRDALRMYSYALTVGINAGKYGQNCLASLASLGNLLLDLNRMEDACTVFKAALTVDPTYWPAKKGLYHYYLAKKKSFRLIRTMNSDAAISKRATWKRMRKKYGYIACIRNFTVK